MAPSNHSPKTAALCILISAVLVCGCKPPSSKASAPPHEERLIRIGSESLFISGEDWVFRYDHEGSPCAIVGNGVGFVERKDDHVVVDVRGQSFFNVRTSGRHSVVVVDLGGSSSVLLRAGDYNDDKELLTAALSAEEGHF